MYRLSPTWSLQEARASRVQHYHNILVSADLFPNKLVVLTRYIIYVIWEMAVFLLTHDVFGEMKKKTCYATLMYPNGVWSFENFQVSNNNEEKFMHMHAVWKVDYFSL